MYWDPFFPYTPRNVSHQHFSILPVTLVPLPPHWVTYNSVSHQPINTALSTQNPAYLDFSRLTTKSSSSLPPLTDYSLDHAKWYFLPRLTRSHSWASKKPNAT